MSVGSGEHVARPSDGGRYALSGPEAPASGGEHVLVHYTKVGTDKPPLADANANGYPDYVERVRDAGEAALAFFANPQFDSKPFPGFQSDVCDSGGPDSRIDIYVRDLGGTLGRSLGPERAVGGGFTLVSPKLASRPRGKAIFKGDGIAFTVAHELFHVVQFGYVPEGIPGWIAEGTANTLAFFFTDIDHPVVIRQADMWLRNPGRPLWYPGFSCDRCYGGIWWWAVTRKFLRTYFEQLAAFALEPEGIGSGVEALEVTFERELPDFESLVTPALYSSFAYSFAPAMVEAAYPRTIKPPPVTYSIVAQRLLKTRHVTLHPFSVQYVSIRVSGGSRSFQLMTSSHKGPQPWPTLLLGFRERPGRRALVRRSIAPCFTTFLGKDSSSSYGIQDHRLAVDIRSPRERKSDLLVVANPSNQTLRYTLSYSSSRGAARLPSPDDRATGSATFCRKHAEAVGGADATGAEEDPLAPDIGELTVSSTKVLSSGDRLVTLPVELRNRAELGRGDIVTAWIDSDQTRSSGCGSWGAEYALVVQGRPGPDDYRLGRCKRGDMAFAGAQGRFMARFDGTHRTLLLLASPRDIGGSVFNFKLEASWTDSAGLRHTDWAPDTSLYCFPDCRHATALGRARILERRLGVVRYSCRLWQTRRRASFAFLRRIGFSTVSAALFDCPSG